MRWTCATPTDSQRWATITLSDFAASDFDSIRKLQQELRHTVGYFFRPMQGSRYKRCSRSRLSANPFAHHPRLHHEFSVPGQGCNPTSVCSLFELVYTSTEFRSLVQKLTLLGIIRSFINSLDDALGCVPSCPNRRNHIPYCSSRLRWDCDVVKWSSSSWGLPRIRQANVRSFQWRDFIDF